MALLLPQMVATSKDSLAALTKKYGNLPPDYIEFLAIHDGAKPPANVLEGTNYSVGVNGFLSASEIISRADSVEGLPVNLLPFGEDDSGNFVCIGTEDHLVYFWDHELDSNKVVAKSFADFLNRLEPFDLSSVKLKSGQVKRVWINPDFKPEF
ncbi:SMI1/KNR4 family protein [Herbaspirillum sp. SJZ099]|uniref:SMI1/KNR4 family protein n=1 Tax=Herbaspirillum sp. SJZ099 TaxID=2572916 RepID=UPI00119CE65F|nr:SMI1/KNR4 family protein [Herbaspirillum sp. SJZ099]